MREQSREQGMEHGMPDAIEEIAPERREHEQVHAEKVNADEILRRDDDARV